MEIVLLPNHIKIICIFFKTKNKSVNLRYTIKCFKKLKEKNI